MEESIDAMPDFRSLTLQVIRHGQCEHNVEAWYAGQEDSPLTPVGREQARENGRLLQGLIAGLGTPDFVASPLHRTCATVELVREAAGLPARGYRTDRRLMELDVGRHSGRPIAEVRQTAEHAAYRSDPWNYVRPGGESNAQLHQRVGEFLQALARDTVIVCHHGSARMIRAHYLGLSPAETVGYAPPHVGILTLAHGGERTVSG